ncbi:hypothetical protein HBB16_10870 [Pseudonocardia sp. MCCB 268]|nr:hypothetical protein [Pseudonocardia cytotoxica]
MFARAGQHLGAALQADGACGPGLPPERTCGLDGDAGNWAEQEGPSVRRHAGHATRNRRVKHVYSSRASGTGGQASPCRTPLPGWARPAAVARPAHITAGRASALGATRGRRDARARTRELLDAGYAAGIRYPRRRPQLRPS